MADDVPVHPVSLGVLVADVRARLRSVGVDDAGREARHLVGTLLDIAPETFLGHPEISVSEADNASVLAGLTKRLAGMPIGRIVGRRDFYGRDFKLGPATLEPRPDSEVLIEAALELVTQAGWRDAPLRIIDVGTGSGCLLITLLAELPPATGVGVDIAPEALEVATRNAQEHRVAERVQFIERDMLDNVDGAFHLLVSNPPYIRTPDLADLDLEVREYDPVAALDGGRDGLEFYRRIGADIERVVPDGWMLFEVGAEMADDVCLEIDVFSGDNRRRDWKVWRDLNGHKRCVAAKTLNNQ